MTGSLCWPLHTHPPFSSTLLWDLRGSLFVPGSPTHNKLSCPLASHWFGQLEGSSRRPEVGEKSGWRLIHLVPP